MAVSITTTSIPNAIKSTAYTTTLAATGGTPAYTWAIITGSLPAGITLTGSTGVIAGTPTVNGSFPITIQVTDTVPNTYTWATTLIVSAVIGGSKTCSVSITDAISATYLTGLCATPLEQMTVGNINRITEALDRVPKGHDDHQVIGNLFN